MNRAGREGREGRRDNESVWHFVAPFASFAVTFRRIGRQMSSSEHRKICDSADLVEGGDGVRFRVTRGGETLPAFAVRYRGRVHAYLNSCTHLGIELDWEPGRFFDLERRWLMCAVHGALYEPATGACAGGPCTRGLFKLPVIEKNNAVYLAHTGSTDAS